MRVFISEKESKSSALCGTGEKEKTWFNTHKEINWGFFYEGFWVLQPQRVEVFKGHLTTLLVSLGSSFFFGEIVFISIE